MEKITNLQRNFKTFNENYINLDKEYWNLSENCHNLLKKIEEEPDETQKSVLRIELLSSFTSLRMKMDEIAAEQDNFLLKSIKNR